MAGKGINLDINANTRGFQAGIKDVDKALDQVADSLDDVARDGEQATEKLERSFKDLADNAKKSGRSLGDGFSSDIKRSSSEASGNMRELGDEAKANLAETLSSFDGTVEGTIAGIQGTLGGVTAGLTGVVPIIAAAAGAAGLGLIAVAFEQGGEQAQKVREQIAQLATEFIETGEIGEASVAYIVEGLKELATTTEEGATNLAALQKQARNAASGFDKIAQAYAGNQEGLDQLIKTEEERLKLLRESEQSGRRAADQDFNDSQAKLTNQQKIIDGLKNAQKVAEEAALAEQAYAASGAAALEAKANSVVAVNDAYDEVAGAVQDFIDKETGVFDTGAYIAAMQEREQAIRNYQETIATSGLSSEAIAYLESQGIEMGSAMLSGYQSSAPSTKAELNRIWTEAASENSGSYLAQVNSKFTTPIKGPQVVMPTPDFAGADAAISNWVGRARTMRVSVEGVTRDGVVIR